MRESTYDSCLLYINEDGINEFDVVGLQTDDTLLLADQKFAEVEEKELVKAKITSKPREMLIIFTPIKFNGGYIKLIMHLNSDHHDTGSMEIHLTQENQIKNLQLVTTKDETLKGARGKVRQNVSPKDQYVAQRARGAYIATVCQPEAVFNFSFAAQTVNLDDSDVKALNKRLLWQVENLKRGLKFVQLDRKTLRLVIFTDALFVNNRDHSSQIGYVICLADINNKANIIH